MKNNKNLKDLRVAFRINSKDYDQLIEIANGMHMTVSKLISYSIEPFLLKRKISTAVSELETADKKDIQKIMASKSLLMFYLGELDRQKLELQNKIDNINIAESFINETK